MFISYIQVGGEALQRYKYSTEIINIIIATIVYLSAFAFLFKLKIGKIFEKKNEKNANVEKIEQNKDNQEEVKQEASKKEVQE